MIARTILWGGYIFSKIHHIFVLLARDNGQANTILKRVCFLQFDILSDQPARMAQAMYARSYAFKCCKYQLTGNLEASRSPLEPDCSQGCSQQCLRGAQTFENKVRRIVQHYLHQWSHVKKEGSRFSGAQSCRAQTQPGLHYIWTASNLH